MRLLGEPRSGTDGEQRNEVEEIPVLDELVPREAQVERRHLERQEWHEDDEQCSERVTLPPPGPEHRGECPRGGERDREDPGSDCDLSHVRGGRVWEAGWISRPSNETA